MIPTTGTGEPRSTTTLKTDIVHSDGFTRLTLHAQGMFLVSLGRSVSERERAFNGDAAQTATTSCATFADNPSPLCSNYP